jgi:hypothetical protein
VEYQKIKMAFDEKYFDEMAFDEVVWSQNYCIASEAEFVGFK